MGKGQFAAIVALMVGLLGVAAFSVFRPPPAAPIPQTRWEYKIVGVPDPEFDSAMATMGSNGWELVFARRASGGREEKMMYECIFKRVKLEVETTVRVTKEEPEGAAAEAVAKMEAFQERMCSCTDKFCADRVNEDMTTWGTEMAKTAGAVRDEKPSPALAKRSADIMTRYTECMTKLMMAGAGR